VSRKTRNRAERCQGCTGTPVSSFARNFTTTVTADVFVACSRCVHDFQMGAQVVDVQLLEPLAKAREHVGPPGHEGLAVGAHQLQWLAAELETVLEPVQDGSRLAVE
jgi:hypothetical protein